MDQNITALKNFDLIEFGKSGQLGIEPRNDNVIVPKTALPFGLPPILSNINHQLEDLLDHPEQLPIHDLNYSQKMVRRIPNLSLIFECQTMPLQSELRAERDAVTGEIENFREIFMDGSEKTTKNSLSLQRQPGQLTESVLGSASNLPFLPGGMEDNINNVSMGEAAEKSSPDHECDHFSDILKIAPGFTIGLDVEENALSYFKFDLSEVLAEHVIERNSSDSVFPNKLRTDFSTPVQQKTTENTDEVDVALQQKTEIPVLAITQTDNRSSEKEEQKSFNWAERINVTEPIRDFKTRLPKMAREWPFELDTFQKQAILKLESHDSVFVAAHTSAGKTVVAEYAIALALKHCTRVIYTSPVKALSNQKFRDFKTTFTDVGLLTGDIQINEKASCLIMTTEILRSMLYNGAETVRDLEWVIFDEVHYINDPQRGVVWEEVLIMLPEQVKLVLLSATVSNTMELADWVGRTKKKKIYVISTPKRPVPLEHFLYTGCVGKTQDEKFLIINSDSVFQENNYLLAKEAKEERTKKSQQNFGPKGTRHNVSANQDKNIYRGLIGHLQKFEKLPVICFTLSRKRCNFNVELLSGIDLTTAREKGAIHKFFRRSIEALKPVDQKLPQVRYMESYLKQGFGIHHSGILPILKEIVEMLFQEGLIKVLFATETFAIGVNMPARTVVFDSIRKHDGIEFRDLLSSEYIQMAGRAGRRGLDDTGTVIVLVKGELPQMANLKIMMIGKPPLMTSKFRVTYGMVLNLLRARQLRVEEILKRSFREAVAQRNRGDQESELKHLAEKMAGLTQMDCKLCIDLENYYRALISQQELLGIFVDQLFTSGNSAKLFTPGRVITVFTNNVDNVIGAILSCNQIKKKLTVVLLCRKLRNTASKNSTDVAKQKVLKKWSTSLHVPISAEDYCVTDIDYTDILRISSLVVTLNRKKAQKLRNVALDQLGAYFVPDLQNLAKTHSAELPWCTISDIEVIDAHRNIITAEQILNSFQCLKCPHFYQHFEIMKHNISIEDEMVQTKKLLSDDNLQLLPNYQNCVQVLQKLGYVDNQRILTMKGRVACEFSNFELLLTEILISNLLAEKTPAEISALLSCFVFQIKTNEEPDLSKALKKCSDEILETAKMIEGIQTECGLSDDPDYRLSDQLMFGLTMVVHEWARGVPFSEITEMTDVDEGIIVRTIQRLTEVLKDIRNAAYIFGDDSLKGKIDESTQAIKRDIVFAASLYTV